ncbi:MAG: PEGA domain-containing protein [Pseudomonadota bacterium]
MRRTLSALSLLSLLAVLPGAALASTLQVTTSGSPVVVILDGKNLGLSPTEVPNLTPGSHELGFQASLFAPLAFTQRFEVPADQDVLVVVDMAARTAEVKTISTAPTPAPVPSGPLWGASGEPAAPAPVAPPAPVATEGALEVLAAEPGAAIFLDGQDTGQVTPATLPALKPGEHSLELRTTCARGSASAAVVAGQTTTANVVLTPGTGTLSVSSSPPGARVFLDDVEVGAAPMQAANVSCGEHRVDLRAPGYLQSTQTVAVPAFQTTAVEAELREEAYGVLVVTPTPQGMQVLVNGNLAGMGPMTIDPIGTGTYDIEITLPGFAPWKEQVEVLKEQTTTTQAMLTPLTKPQRPPREQHFPVVKVALGTVFAGGGIALGVLSADRYLGASAANYELSHDDWISRTEAQTRWDDEVHPQTVQAWAFGMSSVACLSISGALWGSLGSRR